MRWLRVSLFALSCFAGTGAATRAADPEVWFNPHPTLDWMNMWTDNTPWQTAASKVQVLELFHWWLDTATDQQILAMTGFAARHHMKIEMQIQAIERFPGNPCGTTEGYAWPNQLTSEAATLARLKVNLVALTMDEPLWFGHYDTEAGSCQLSIPDLATNIASDISGILALYPQVEIYDTETLPGVTNMPDWKTGLASFHDLLAQATGSRVRGVQLDIGWDQPAWQPALREMQQFVRERNLKLGVIADPSDVARSNAAAVASVVQHFETMEGTLGIIPDWMLFTTWLPYPQYSMPDTDPTAQTWEINRYFRMRTRMVAQFVGQGVQGTLTSIDGKPVVGATINGYVPGVDFSQPLAATVIQNVVPANAAYGLLGIRLNTECNCVGLNDVLVGTLQYQETQGGSSAFSYQYPPLPSLFNGAIVDGEWVGGTQVARFITTPTQTFYANSAYFPVTPGANFTFTAPASTIGGEGWYGNLFLLWADANKHGIVRVNVIPDAGKRLMSSATTAADGTFQLSKLPRIGPGSAPVTVEFAGDDTYRAVGWSPLQ